MKHLELILWLIGLGTFILAGYVWMQTQQAQNEGAAELAELLNAPLPDAARPRAIEEGTVFGRIDVQRLGLSAIVFEGVQTATLSKGVGHVPGTGNSVGHDNLVLAAHRDTFFRPLRDIRKGDLIEVVTLNGTKPYLVRDWEIVEPTAVEVLLATDTPLLTLVTCYPFTFVGAAPQRFIVRAVPAEQ